MAGQENVGGGEARPTGAAEPIVTTAPLNPNEAPAEGKAAPFGTIGDKVFQTQDEFLAWNAEQTGTPLPPKEAGAEDGPAKEEPKADPAKDAPKEDARSDDDIRASLKAAGGIYADPNYEAAAIEFERTGDVSDETLAATAKAFNVDVATAKAFVEGQKAQRTLAATSGEASVVQLTSDLHKAAGGEAEFTKFLAWGAENLTQAEQDSYDKALASDPETAKVLFNAFNERFKAAGNGPSPRDLTMEAQGSSTAPASVQGYASQAEQSAAMNDPRYETDEAYRKTVYAKVGASKF